MNIIPGATPRGNSVGEPATVETETVGRNASDEIVLGVKLQNRFPPGLEPTRARQHLLKLTIEPDIGRDQADDAIG